MSHRILIAGLVTGAMLAPRPAGGLMSAELGPEAPIPFETQSRLTLLYESLCADLGAQAETFPGNGARKKNAS